MITGQTILMIPFNIHNLSLRYAHVEMENLKIGKCHHYWSIPFIKCLCQPSRHPAPPLFSFFERKKLRTELTFRGGPLEILEG